MSSRGWVCSCLLLVIADTQATPRMTKDGVDGNDLTVTSGNPLNINGPGDLKKVYKATLNEPFAVAFKVEGYPTSRVTRVTFKRDNSQSHDVMNWSQNCPQDSGRIWTTTLILVIPNITKEMLDANFFVDVNNSHGSIQFNFTLSSQDRVHGGGRTAIIISTIVCVIIISATSVAVFLIVKKNKIIYDRPAKIRRRACDVYKFLRKRTSRNTAFWDGDPDTYHEIVDNLDETFRRLDADITKQEDIYLELIEPVGSDDNSAGEKDHQDAERMDYLHPVSESPHFLRKSSNTIEYTTPIRTTSSAPQNLDAMPRATSMSESCTENAEEDTHDLKTAVDKSALTMTAYNRVEDDVGRDLVVSSKSDFERGETPLREIDVMKECEHVDAQLRKIRRVITEIVRAELVDIHGTQEDISVFSEIVRAEQVDIHGTQKHTSVISEIAREEQVDMHGTQEDTSIISEIVRAEQVDMHGTQKDTSVISEIAREEQVDIHGTQEDTSIISEIAKEEQVDMQDTQEDTSVISEIARAEQVDMHGTHEDTSFLSEIAKEEQVDMHGTQEDTSVISEIAREEQVDMHDTQEDTSVISEIARAEQVDMLGTHEDTSVISEIARMEQVDMHGTEEDTSVISGIARVEQVDIHGTQEDTTVISEIARAEQVDMCGAQEGTCMDNEIQMRDFRLACDKLAFKMAAYHQAHRDLVLSRGREKSRLSEADMVKEYEHIDAHLKKIQRVISDIIRMEQVRKSHVQEGTS